MLYELDNQQAPYWFNNEEVKRLQVLNQEYMQKKDLTEIVSACFRKPNEGEEAKALNTTQMLDIIRQEFPSVAVTHRTKIELGHVLKSLDFERREHGHAACYVAVPLAA